MRKTKTFYSLFVNLQPGIIIKFFMNQQKLLQNPRTNNPRIKDQAKIGFLTAKSTLPPVQTRSSNRSKICQSLDQLSSRKKHKVSDIYYEEVTHKKAQNLKMNSIIIQKDTIMQHSSQNQQDKGQTVIKMHQKWKSPEKLLELCQLHQNKLKNQPQKQQISQKASSRIRAHHCCKTQPSQQQNSNKESRLNMLLKRNLQSKEKLKNSIFSTPQKLQPLKPNRSEKAELIESRMKQLYPVEKNSKFKLFLSPIQAKVISEKLSQPKCASGCGKKNCHCFNESQFKKVRYFNRKNNLMSDKQIALKKININISRLKDIENEENADGEINQNINNLRKRINEKKTFRKNMRLKKLKQFNTEGIQNEKFFHDITLNQSRSDPKDLSQSKISQNDSLFTATLSPVKSILIKSRLDQIQRKQNQEQNKNKGHKRYRTTEKQHYQKEGKQHRNTHPEKDHQIKINTFQSEIYVQETNKEDYGLESENIPLGIRTNIKVPRKQQSISVQNIKSPIQQLNQQPKGRKFTFVKQKQSQNPQRNQLDEQTVIEKKRKTKDEKVLRLKQKLQYWITYDIKSEIFVDLDKKTKTRTKDEKALCLKQKTQYWMTYDIEKGIFMDLNKKTVKKQKQISKIRLVSSVIKQTIQNHHQKPSKQTEINNLSLSKHIQTDQQQSQNLIEILKQKQQNHIRETQSTNTHKNLDLTASLIKEQPSHVPLTLQTRSPEKIQKQLESRVLGKSRKCTSSRSNKHSINMFNRNPKSLTSTRSKQSFKVPNIQECVQFIKNYKPENPQIVMQNLVKKQNFKVLPMNRRVYFGQVIKGNVKHGFGVEISPNQIFEGKYENDNKKQGFLKQHDGVYEGPFQNNLRHGYGIFRWNDGQIFKGEWRMGTKNGYGFWKGTDGSYYEGDWHLSMQHGKGKFVHFTSTYQGEFKNFHKQGFGKQSFPNGDVFKGEYKNGKPNGHGKYQWKDGTYYEGYFNQGLRDGHGKWHENSNRFYQGSFKDDNKHGRGVEYFKDGSFLQGEFFNGSLLKGILYNSRRQIIQQFSEQLQKILEQ